METTAFVFGIMGFVLGAGAMNKFSSLQKEFKKLKKTFFGKLIIIDAINVNCKFIINECSC